MSEKVRFVKIGNAMFVGTSKLGEEGLSSPRLVFMNNETGEVTLSTMMGLPECIVFPKPDYHFIAADQEFIDFYYKHINAPQTVDSEEKSSIILAPSL